MQTAAEVRFPRDYLPQARWSLLRRPEQRFEQLRKLRSQVQLWKDMHWWKVQDTSADLPESITTTADAAVQSAETDRHARKADASRRAFHVLQDMSYAMATASRKLLLWSKEDLPIAEAVSNAPPSPTADPESSVKPLSA
ncbi:hypothetical protein BST61_g7283 [Cercospora zeina]